MGEADEKVAAYVTDRFRSAHSGSRAGGLRHLATCPGLRVTRAYGRDGTYGCDTGCEYATFEAEFTCPHHEGGPFTWTFGTFGELAWIIEEIDNPWNAVNDEKAEAGES